jgi:hypothetical protein
LAPLFHSIGSSDSALRRTGGNLHTWIEIPDFFEKAFDIIPVARKFFQNLEHTAFDDGHHSTLEVLQDLRTIVIESWMEAFGDFLFNFCNAGKIFCVLI